MNEAEKDDGMQEIMEHYQNYSERSRFGKFVPYLALGLGLLAFVHELFLLGPYLYIGYRVANTMGAEGLEKPVVYLFWLPMIILGGVKNLLWK